MREDESADYLQIEAIRQVLHFNRVIVLTVITRFLFFAMSMLVSVGAMPGGEM